MSDPQTESIISNWKFLNGIILGFCEEHGTKNKENLTYERYFPIFFNAQKILTQNAGIDKPSVFKRSAAFILAFLQESPLIHAFKGEDDIYKMVNHQNAIVAFEYIRFALTTAVIYHEKRGEIPLKNQIEVSPHFYGDLIHALVTLPKNDSAFHALSLLIESLTYQANPEAQDSPKF